jgi:hypothetical protein
MPKLGEMAQLSRPFQIAFVAVCLLAAVWLFALQGHSTSTSGAGSSAAVSTSAPPASKPIGSAATHSASSGVTAAAEAKAAAAPSHIYHGSAPGVEGLTRDIAKAHQAVAISQQNAKRLEDKSAQASNEAAAQTSGTTTAHTSGTTTPVTHTHSAATSVAQSPASTSTAPATRATVKQQPIKAQTGADQTPARQALVEHALDEGKVAVILFWNPKGADDVAVNDELKLLEAVHHLIRPVAHVPQVRRVLERSGLELQKKFAAFEAPADQVASFGSITRDVQIYATPTILVINKRGQTIVLNGLQDAYSIEQAIDEVRNS